VVNWSIRLNATAKAALFTALGIQQADTPDPAASPTAHTAHTSHLAPAVAGACVF